MKKDIYIIKNSVNNKVYIGQSKDVAKRWLNHVYNARYENKINKHRSLLHEAMSEYGYEKFHYEILESRVENFDEREQYWIEKYNSRTPNGYNISVGGKGNGIGIQNPFAIFKNEEELNKCICEISSSNKSLTNIAKKFNCKVEVIIAINSGERYHNENLQYPLRDTHYKYSKDLVKQIIYSLKHETDLTYDDICRKYHIDRSQLCKINSGAIYRIYSENYPLRKKRLKDLDEEILKNIINDILFSQLPMAGIAEKHNVSRSLVSAINTGYSYRRNFEYPLRAENDSRNNCVKVFLDIDEVRQIIEQLKTSKSIIEIATEHNISKSVVCNINNGSTKKYKLAEYKYPIRKLK